MNTEAHAQARAAKKAGEEWVPIGERRVAVFTRWARTGDSHLRGLGITRDGTDGFDPTQDERDPADVTAPARGPARRRHRPRSGLRATQTRT